MEVMMVLDCLVRGGTQSLLIDVCRKASTCGLNMTMVAMGEGDSEREFEASGVRFLKIRRQWPIDPMVVLFLRRNIVRFNINVVHAHEVVAGLHCFLACMGLKTKTILNLHGYLGDQKNRLTMKFLAPRMDANIAVSTAFLSDFISRTGIELSDNFHVIYNGIDADRLIAHGRLKGELGLATGDVLLGMVGNFINDVRDQMTICKALPEIFARFPNTYFAFAGARSADYPQFFDDCVALCRQNNILHRVFFLDKRGDIGNILNSLDVFVYSSNFDTFGIAVVEAMLVGVPVVVNDLPVFHEILSDRKSVLFYRTKDVSDLVQKIAYLLYDKNQTKVLGCRGKAFAVKLFSITQYIENLKALYARV